MARFWLPRMLKDEKVTTFQGKLTGVFDNIKTVGDYVLYSAFYNNTGIKGSVSFPSLTTVGKNGLSYVFYKCTGITGSLNFPALTTVGQSGLYSAFNGCKGITSVSFPALTTVDTNGLSSAFKNCTGITELHFRADAQSVIEAATGYSSKFGATNATIYFDL